MVAIDFKEIKRDWLFTFSKLASRKFSKLRKRVLHTAYKVVTRYSVAAEILHRFKKQLRRSMQKKFIKSLFNRKETSSWGNAEKTIVKSWGNILRHHLCISVTLSGFSTDISYWTWLETQHWDRNFDWHSKGQHKIIHCREWERKDVHREQNDLSFLDL